MSQIIVQRRDLILPNRHRQRGFIINPFRYASGGGGGGSTVACLLHFDGANGATTTTDATGKTVTMSGGAQISTAQSVFGGSSLYLPSAGRVEVADSTDFDFGTGAFLIEWRERVSSYTNYMNAFSRGYNLAGGMFFQSASSGGSARSLYFVNGSGVSKSIGTAVSYGATNTWVTWAIQRDATGVVRCFKDGVQQFATAITADTTLPLGLRAPWVWGADNASSYWLRGYIDEGRVQKGVAPYGAGGYTPATSAFTYP